MASKGINCKDEVILNAIFNPHNPLEIDHASNLNLQENEKNSQITSDLKQLEIDAVNAAQNGQLIESLNMFNELLNKAPNYASGYNNRAQLLRLQGENDSAVEDLNKAIFLSGGTGFVASRAHVQRALLYQLNEDEENAKVEFEKAAELGNKFAKQQLIMMNPYAALCNQMLSEVFAKELNPSS